MGPPAIEQTQEGSDKARWAARRAQGRRRADQGREKGPGPEAAAQRRMHFCAERRPSLTEELKAQLGADFKYTLVMTKLGEETRRRRQVQVRGHGRGRQGLEGGLGPAPHLANHDAHTRESQNDKTPATRDGHSSPWTRQLPPSQ